METFDHLILEVVTNGRTQTIAKARNWVQAYGIAQIMSRSYTTLKYTAVNDVTGLRLTYENGILIRKQHCTCGRALQDCTICRTDLIENLRMKAKRLIEANEALPNLSPEWAENMLRARTLLNDADAYEQAALQAV